ncbi:MAG TPA: phosphoesterase [Terriglobales bacterium]|nr:phosphoesterase [Terriglobales bacterium]
MKSYMVAFALMVVAAGFLVSQEAATPPGITLPTSKTLASGPGRLSKLNSFPATIAISPDGHSAAMLHAGYGTQDARGRQSISVVNLDSSQVVDFPEERLPEEAHQSYFVGLAFSGDGNHLYASVGSITDPTGQQPGDTGNAIAVYGFRNGKVTPERSIKIPPSKLAADKRVASALVKTPGGTAIPYPAGLAVVSSPGGDRLVIAGDLSDDVILLEAATGKILHRFDLSTNALVPAAYPYRVVVSGDGRRAWCSLWNASQVVELDLEKGEVTRWIPLLKPESPIAPGSHPSALLLSPDEKTLYVALANTDFVAAVSTADGKPTRWFSTMLAGQPYGGTSPVALAQSPNGKQLFVATATLDAVAVFDTAVFEKQPTAIEAPQRASGFIPTEWYPTALAVQGDDLWIATAKGQGSGPNNGTSLIPAVRRHREHPYIPTLVYGSLARLNYPEAAKHLPELTRQVEDNNLLRSDPGQIQFRRGEDPIKHVIYIIRENRTYDQVLGDLKPGNGDPALTMYGEDVTPNAHKLALQFGVLDNFYDSGEVSGDGHVWSTAAITSDYNEANWQIAYRSRERTYDFGGTVAGEYPADRGIPNVDSPQTGYLWANAAAHGLAYRDYGEFIDTEFCTEHSSEQASPKEGKPQPIGGECGRESVKKGDPLPPNVGQPRGGPSPYPWAIPLIKRGIPTMPELQDHADLEYASFNVDYPDQLRADEFLNEFQAFVRAQQEGKGRQLPGLVILHLPNDHTGGTRPGKPTPSASVADNDLALGRIVEAVSHSTYWDDTAIFVLEDDAQDGADHVDAHRSVALVISKYAPGSANHPFLEHNVFTTVSVVHTIETLLGLPPMNLNDAYAPVMASEFSGPGDQSAYTADTRNLGNGLIYKVNGSTAPGANESSGLDFSHPDAADTVVLNRVLWRDRKGHAVMPAPVPTAIQAESKDDD